MRAGRPRASPRTGLVYAADDDPGGGIAPVAHSRNEISDAMYAGVDVHHAFAVADARSAAVTLRIGWGDAFGESRSGDGGAQLIVGFRAGIVGRRHDHGGVLAGRNVGGVGGDEAVVGGDEHGDDADMSAPAACLHIEGHGGAGSDEARNGRRRRSVCHRADAWIGAQHVGERAEGAFFGEIAELRTRVGAAA